MIQPLGALFLLMSYPSFAFADAPRVISCLGGTPVTSLEIAQRQIAMPFEEKFAHVTNNPATQGRKNLDDLKKTMTTDSSFDVLYMEAEKIAEEAKQDLVLVHGTSSSSFQPILKSGSLFGTDELIRRKIRGIESKIGTSMTNMLVDGEIGEQDVVYLAYQPKTERGLYGFGDVFFLFEDTVLDQAYFTLNSFNVGASADLFAPVSNSDPNDPSKSECLQDEYRKQIAEYRKITFRGQDQAQELLVLSALQTLRMKDWRKTFSIFSEAKALKNDYDAKLMVASRNGSLSQEMFRPTFAPLQNLCAFLLGIGQAGADCSNQSHPTSMRLINSLSEFAEDKSGAASLIEAYPSFPSYGESTRGLFYRPAHWFWEVKVPRELPLDFVREIRIPTYEQNWIDGKLQYEPRDTSSDEAAILAFAATRGWKVLKKQISDHALGFVFDKNKF